MRILPNLLAVPALALLCAVCLPSCDKNNPQGPNRDNPVASDLRSAAFELTLLDGEQGFCRDSHYVFEGIWKDGAFRFGLQKLDEMTPNIRPDGKNRLEFTVSSDVAGFEGVNATSSARCINIVPDGNDHTRYHLEWVAEGESTITFWNGEGAGRKEISFKATARKEIPLEGIKMRIDGEMFLMCPVRGLERDPDYPSCWLVRHAKDQQYFESRNHSGIKTRIGIAWTHQNPLDPGIGHVLEIIGPEPLNATGPRLRTYFDPFALIDPWQRVTYNTDLFPLDLFPPKKAYGLYEGNLAHYPDFRWFAPMTMAEYDYGKWGPATIPMMETFLTDDRYSLLPGDLRERRILIYDATGNIQVGFHDGLMFAIEDQFAPDILNEGTFNGYMFTFSLYDNRYHDPWEDTLY